VGAQAVALVDEVLVALHGPRGDLGAVAVLALAARLRADERPGHAGVELAEQRLVRGGDAVAVGHSARGVALVADDDRDEGAAFADEAVVAAHQCLGEAGRLVGVEAGLGRVGHRAAHGEKDLFQAFFAAAAAVGALAPVAVAALAV